MLGRARVKQVVGKFVTSPWNGRGFNRMSLARGRLAQLSLGPTKGSHAHGVGRNLQVSGETFARGCILWSVGSLKVLGEVHRRRFEVGGFLSPRLSDTALLDSTIFSFLIIRSVYFARSEVRGSRHTASMTRALCTGILLGEGALLAKARQGRLYL